MTECLQYGIQDAMGKKYAYHIKNRDVLFRPRIPLRYDFNDVDKVQLTPDEKDKLRILPKYMVYRFKRTGYSIANTLLLHTLALLLIITSILNMKRILTILQSDTNTLQTRDKVMFRVGFILSFIIVLFLVCYVGVSLFELFHNGNNFGMLPNNRKDLTFPDGNYRYFRYIFVLVVLVSTLIAMAEIFNLFFAETSHPAILFLFLPVVLCFILLLET